MPKQIFYSQCWEDPQILSEALQIRRKDTVVSITSGGCNTLSLLLDNPQEVIAVDINPHQNWLLELKAAALKTLSHDDLLRFVGVMPASDRLDCYKQTRQLLSPEARAFWDASQAEIGKGIIHVGRFERYLALFRNTVLRLTQSQAKIKRLLAFSDCKKQADFYALHWNTPLWRASFSLFFSTQLMAILGRRREYFKYADIQNTGSHYLKQIEGLLNRMPSAANPYLEYILTGNYRRNIPLYLQKNSGAIIRDRLNRLKIKTCSLSSLLQQRRRNAKYNLSDIFEYMPAQRFREHVHTLAIKSGKGSRIALWNNLAQRTAIEPEFKSLRELAATLKRKDRLFFYSDFFVGEKP